MTLPDAHCSLTIGQQGRWSIQATMWSGIQRHCSRQSSGIFHETFMSWQRTHSDPLVLVQLAKRSVVMQAPLDVQQYTAGRLAVWL